MADFTQAQGEIRNKRVTVRNELAAVIDITNAIIKVMIKRLAGDDDANALATWLSYDSSRILKSDPVNGEYFWLFRVEDTVDLDPDEYCFENQITRRGNLQTSGAPAGTIAVTNGSGIMTGTALDLPNIRKGDQLVPLGGSAPNQIPVTVQEVEGSAGAGNLLTDYTSWGLESGIAIEVYQGLRSPPAEGKGSFIITNGLVD